MLFDSLKLVTGHIKRNETSQPLNGIGIQVGCLGNRLHRHLYLLELPGYLQLTFHTAFCTLFLSFRTQ